MCGFALVIHEVVLTGGSQSSRVSSKILIFIRLHVMLRARVGELVVPAARTAGHEDRWTPDPFVYSIALMYSLFDSLPLYRIHRHIRGYKGENSLSRRSQFQPIDPLLSLQPTLWTRYFER